MVDSSKDMSLRDLEKKISVSQTKKEISATLFSTLKLGWWEFKKFLGWWFWGPAKKVKNFIDSNLEEFDKKWAKLRDVFR